MHVSRIMLLALLLLGAVVGCGGGAEGYEVQAVLVTPASRVMPPGSVATFTATVLGNGVVPQEIAWSVESTMGAGPVGAIDASGTYRASPEGDGTRIAVRATSKVAPAVSGMAIVEVLTPRVFLAPTSVDLAVGGFIQFSGSLVGIPGAWRWGCSHGSIDATGRYVAPSRVFPAHDLVWIESVETGVRAEAEVRLHLAAPVSVGAVGPHAPGDLLRLAGNGIPDTGPTFAIFPSASGVPLRVVATASTHDVSVVVPPGAVSGELRVEVTSLDGDTATSAPLAFDRAPRLRIRPEEIDLAAGQTTRIRVDLFGTSPPPPVSLETDLGSLDGDRYLAPAEVAASTFATVRACLVGTTTCAGATLVVHPFLVEPSPALVPAGGTLALSAVAPGPTRAAVFSVVEGRGVITSQGQFSAASERSRAWVAVERAGATRHVEVGVTGLVPGLLQRVSDHVDRRAGGTLGQPWGTVAMWAAVGGGRLYVVGFQDQPEVGTFIGPPWLDVYDLADPVRPRWLGAVELHAVLPQLQLAGGRLYVYEGSDQPPVVAVYDLSTPLPTLMAHQYWPGRPPGDLLGIPSPTFDARSMHTYGPFDPSSRTVSIRIHDLEAGPLPEPQIVQVPIPGEAKYLPGRLAVSAHDGRAYLSFVDPDGASWLQVWDISADSPSLLSTLPVPTMALPAFPGNHLYYAGCFYDPEPATPRLLGCLPEFVGNMLHLAGVAGSRAYFGDGARLHVIDLAAEGCPRVVSSLTARVGAPQGGYYYQAVGDGGIEILDVEPLGGPTPRAVLDLPQLETINATAVRGSYLHATGHDSHVGFLATWDLAASPPTLVSRTDFAVPGLSLAAVGDLLVVATERGLDVRSLADPANPTPATWLAIPAFTVADGGDLAWVGTLGGDLVAVDVASPAGPMELGRLALGMRARTIVPLGAGMLAVALADADGTTGDLAVVDGSVPFAPALISTMGLGTPVIDLDVAGAVAVLATFAGVLTVDLSVPGLPRLLGMAVEQMTPIQQAYHPVYPLAVRLHAGLAWAGMMNTYAEVVAFDLTDPTVPRPVARLPLAAVDLTQWVYTLTAAADRLYATRHIGGFFDDSIYQLDLTQPLNQLRSAALPDEPGP